MLFKINQSQKDKYHMIPSIIQIIYDVPRVVKFRDRK